MIITRKKINRNFIYFTLLAVIIIDVIRYLSFKGVKSSFTNVLSVFLAYASIAIVLRVIRDLNNSKQSSSAKVLFKIWLFYALLSVARGIYAADDYWDYRFLGLTAIPFIFICMFFYIGQNINLTRNIIMVYLKKYIILISVLGILTYSISPQIFSRLVVPFGFLLIFTPYLKKKWSLFILCIIVISILSNPSFRTNVIKSVVSILILLGYYFKFVYKPFFLKIIFIAGIAMPLVLLWFGLFGGFNIFEELTKTDGVEVTSRTGQKQAQNTDTRTFIYYEIITDVLKNKSILFGKSPSQGYSSPYFKKRGDGGFHNGVRYRGEVNILNIFLYFGLTGVVLYLLVLLNIAYLGLFKSSNLLAKMLGLILLSRYVLSFLEEFTQYDMNFWFFWLFAGLVSSTSFRAMSDNQIKEWFSGKVQLIKFKYQ